MVQGVDSGTLAAPIFRRGQGASDEHTRGDLTVYPRRSWELKRMSNAGFAEKIRREPFSPFLTGCFHAF